MAGKKTDFKSILRLDHELHQIQDIDLLLERVLSEARSVVHADAGSIYVKDGNKLVIKYSQNDTLQRELPPGQKLIYSVFSFPINEKTISGYSAFKETLVNVPDAYKIPADAPYSFSTSYDKISGYKTTSTLTVPLISSEGKLLGVIQVINAKDNRGNTIPFSKDDEFIITHFAANATIALQRAQVTRAMILRMIKMSELRDPNETGTHVNRVAGYAVEIYDRWASNHSVHDKERERFRDDLRIASMLHDVGKVAISDVILKKPGRFTEEEYLTMQHHTIYGTQLFIGDQSRLDVLSADISLTHHENWDGTGYPGWVSPEDGTVIKADENGHRAGKKGTEIPLAGRIVAIADVFDALCSRRVYKEPWAEDEVLTEIRRLSGTKFDPELVEVFFEILPNINQIRNLYPESI